MLKYPYYEVNAFTHRPLTGNPAGVVLLDRWLADDSLQAIAAQNNLSETAFVVPSGEEFAIRWFTPNAEVDLCGHATLATAHVLAGRDWPDGNPFTFRSKSGVLSVYKAQHGFEMILPSRPGKPYLELDALRRAIGVEIE